MKQFVFAYRAEITHYRIKLLKHGIKLMQTIGDIRKKYGGDMVKRAISYKDKRLTKEGEGHGSSLPTSHK